MRQIGFIKFNVVLCVLVFGTFLIHDVEASQPNIVLSRALHFHAPNGIPITLGPGKYFVEPAGGSELRLTKEGQQKEIIIHAEAMNHEQYELFSPMALTRPAKDHQFFIALLLPGGQKLEAKGSTKALPSPVPPVATSKVDPVSALTIPQPVEPTSPVPPTVVEPTLPPPSVPVSPPSVPISPPSVPVSPPSVSVSPPPVPAKPKLNYQAPDKDSEYSQIDPPARGNDRSPRLLVYAPDHLGHTVHEQPTLFWYLSEATNHPIDVILTERGDVEIVFDMRLLPPLQAGIHNISLEDYGIRLLQNVPYRWQVKLRAASSQDAATASGFIKRVPPSGSIPSRMNQELPTPTDPRLYARSGLWYDALWALSDLIRTEPRNITFLEQRASLLEQVGLKNLAGLDRHRIAAK